MPEIPKRVLHRRKKWAEDNPNLEWNKDAEETRRRTIEELFAGGHKKLAIALMDLWDIPGVPKLSEQLLQESISYST